MRDGLLSVDEPGDPIRPEWHSDEWRRACKRAGVEPVTLHAARHTSVSLMRDVRLPDHDVAEWHRHDGAVMRRPYSHAWGEGLRTAGTAFFDAIEAAGKGSEEV